MTLLDVTMAVRAAADLARDQAREKEASKSLRRYLYDPVGWARSSIDWGSDGGLTFYQDEIIAALVEHGRAAARGPHGLGKTTLLSVVVLWFSTTRDAAEIDWKIIATASAWRQLSIFLFPEIHKWARRIRWDALGRPQFSERHELLDLNLKLNYGAASAVASNDPAKIEGAHADSLLYIFDEAKAIPSATWDAAEGAFSGGRKEGLPEAFALAVSTPGPPAGRFYEIHKRARGLEDWWTRHVTLEEAITAGRISQEWAKQRERQWGAESALYNNRVLGNFYASDEDSVIPLSWLEAAVERWHAWADAGKPPVPGRRVLGVDVARSGGDETVFAFRSGPCIEYLEQHTKEDTMQTTAKVQGRLAGDRVPIVDSIGVGGGVVDRLREVRVPVIAYTGSAKTDAKDRSREYGFTNVRSAAYWRVRELLDPSFEPELMLPPDELLLSDLSAPTWKEVTGVPPKIQVEPKEDVVARLGRSTDRGDAVVMGFWADRHGEGSAASVAPLASANLLPWGR